MQPGAGQAPLRGNSFKTKREFKSSPLGMDLSTGWELSGRSVLPCSGFVSAAAFHPHLSNGKGSGVTRASDVGPAAQTPPSELPRCP